MNDFSILSKTFLASANRFKAEVVFNATKENTNSNVVKLSIPHLFYINPT